MDIVKMYSPTAQTLAVSMPTQLDLPTTLISKGGNSLAPATNSIQVLQAGYYLVTIEAQIIGTGNHKISLRRGGSFVGPSTETMELSGNAGGVNYGRTLIVKASAGTFFYVEGINGGAGTRDFQASLCVARLAGA